MIPGRRRLRLPRLSLARQMLALQLGIVAVVLVGVAAVSVAQLEADDEATAGRRALAVAERLAVTSGVREAAATDGDLYLNQAQSVIESGKSLSGSADVSVALPDARIIASTNPDLRTSGSRLQYTDAFEGRSWVGREEGTGAALAMAPIINLETRHTDGVVAVSRADPSVWANLGTALPNLLTYVGIASVLGVAGSLLLSRRLKRQTLGLEPREITGLVEHREALLRGIKEGVIAVDLDCRVTMVNEQATRLLGIPALSAGRHVREVDPSGLLVDIFTGHPAGGSGPAGLGSARDGARGGDRGSDDRVDVDRVVPVGDRLLTLNRMPVRSHGRHIGWVVTLRDRTEMLGLQRELDLNRSTADGLRAQAHEFSNRLHVVNGLIALEEFAAVRSYIRQITADSSMLTASVADHVTDPAVAALLVAKASQATEWGVRFVVDPATRLGMLEVPLAADVNTVVGNLLDNAFEAASGGVPVPADAGPGAPLVRVEIVGDDDVVVVTVRDSGPGVDEAVADSLFSRGISTKTAAAGSVSGGRGIGLALVRVVCRRRGGDVVVHNDPQAGGAVFVATLPVRPVPGHDRAAAGSMLGAP